MLTVDIEGSFDNFSSYNFAEAGYHLEEWQAYDENGKVVELTKKEAEYAVERLYDEMERR